MLAAAPDLLGCVVEHRSPDGAVVAVRLTEVEAYAGESDPGSHAFRGRTPRTAVMFGPPGRAYVYFSYGMHWCMNLVCGPDGTASAVLLRAGEVVAGAEVAAARRPTARASRELARGPARLTLALGVTGEQDGADVCGGSGLLVRPGEPVAPGSVATGPRTGVSGAGGVAPWRFWLRGDPTVSPYRAHPGPRRRPGTGSTQLSG